MSATPPLLRLRGVDHVIDRPWLMGIVNASPESFSDGDEMATVDQRFVRLEQLAAEGAHLVDIGGQSAVTGEPELPAQEELDRVAPLVAAAVDRYGLLVSVDTYKPTVVQAVLDAGAGLINDVSGLAHPEVAGLVADAGAGLVLMHTRTPPKTKLLVDDYYAGVEGGVTGDVLAFLETTMQRAVAAGVPESAIVLDPGPDFAKTPYQTIMVLRELDRVLSLGRPVLLALSRKDFVGALTGRRPKERGAGTLGAVGAVADRAGLILRVHEVAATADYLAVRDALDGRSVVAPDLRLDLGLRREAATLGEEGLAAVPTGTLNDQGRV